MINKRLAEFLIELVQDPPRLARFNSGPEGRASVLRGNRLTPADIAALESDDAARVLEQLNVGPHDDVAWVIAPGVRTYTVGFGIRGPKFPKVFGIRKPFSPKRSSSTRGASATTSRARGGKKVSKSSRRKR